jgi:radical SAM protein with 4Fe4S-binding SPASM domain
VDGLPETHDPNRGERGALETTLNALRYYREIDIPLRVVNTLVHPGNIDQLSELFEHLKEAGMTRWRFALATSVGRASGEDQWVLPDAQIDELFDYVAEARRSFDIELSEEMGYLGSRDLPTRNTPFICPSGLSFCVIMPDGNVLPCQVVYDNRFSEGNVREQSIKDIWANGFQRFRKEIELAGVCGSCRHRDACSGGCWARVVNDQGSCLRGIWDPEHYGHERLASGEECSGSEELKTSEP